MRRAEPSHVRRARAERRDDVDRDAKLEEEPGQLLHIVPVAEAEPRRPDDVAADPLRPRHRLREMPHDLEEGLVRPEILLPLIAREVERDDRDRQVERRRHAARIVLDQLRRAGGADDDRLRPEALIGVAARVLEKVRRVGAKVARLEGRVGYGRPMVTPLDHREEKVGVGVALRRMKNVMQPLHAGGDAHGADMRRAFIGPDGQLHPAASPVFGASAFSISRRRSGRAKSAARSPACS